MILWSPIQIIHVKKVNAWILDSWSLQLILVLKTKFFITLFLEESEFRGYLKTGIIKA